MILEILIAMCIGIFIGIFTGLTPGLHVNMVSLLALTFSPIILHYTTPIGIAVFIISMCITHTFLDFIPSVFLGAPNEDTALSILPGHKLLLMGKAYDAIRLTVIGSLGGLIFCIVLIPLIIPLFIFVYPFVKLYIGILLIIMVLYMILRDKHKILSLIVFLFSGILGIFVFSIPNLKDPLFPLLSGLFGISTLLISLSEDTKVPKQDLKPSIFLSKKKIFKSLGLATFAGTLTAFFPGMGTSQGAVIASEIDRSKSDTKDWEFIILVGGIAMVNFVLSLITFYTINKGRNGAIVVVQELIKTISLTQLILFLSVMLVVAGIATFLTLSIAKVFSNIITKVNYKALVIIIMIFITSLVFYFNGFIGISILLVSTSIGIIPGKLGIARSHAMGCLILPVIMYFL
ncbi:MAG: tripartite tricarboxylate transporter permease [Candidatus Woesearchaeota archaeon]|jgi:putative membrane protein